MTKKILSLLLLTATFAACNNEDIITGSENGTPLKLNVQTAEINTRAVIETTTLPDASQIGVTLVDDTGTTYDGITYNNLLYTTSGTECTTENTPMLSATTGTLYGYFPYNSDVTDMTQIPVTAGNTDFMYATPVQNLSDGKPTANMQMNHALAVIRLNIVRGTYTGTGAVTSVAVKGDNIATAGTLDAETGALSSQTGAGEAINNTTAFTLSAQAKQIDNIIVPVTNSSATPTFTMTIDGSEYIATADAVSLEQGYIYTYTLTVNGKDVSLSDVTVGDWGYNDSGNPVINAGYKITLAGDLTGIAINNTVNDDGSVTITAVPNYVLPVAKAIAKADCSAGATCTQSLNELGGQTILLSNITQDIILTFNGVGYKNGVYAITATGELIAYDDAAVDATCLGVVLITDNQRIMIAKNDATDGTNTTLYWGYNLYGKDVAGITETTKSNVAKADFNGKSNTAAIIAAYTEHAVEMDSRDMCKVLQDLNAAEFADWYVPSAGQLYEIYNNRTAIDEALTAIGGTSTSGTHWSSSEYSSNWCWFVNISNGNVDDSSKNRSNRVRFVRDIE